MECLKLAWQSVCGKKRSSVLMSVILAISFAFAVITLSVSGSMIKTNDVFRKTTYGEWQLILPGINSKLKGAAANSDWLDELGVMNVYGTIGEDGVGTVDETLKKLGHITVNEGRFPESDGEIAMEADLLSKLGIDYTLGQDVTLSVSIAARENSALGTSHPVNVVGTYQLVGIIKEYTDVWTWATKPVCELDGTSSRTESGISATLCSALLTENACAEIVRQAQLQAEAFNNAEKEQGSDLRIKLCDAPTSNFFCTGFDTDKTNFIARVYQTVGSVPLAFNATKYAQQETQTYNIFFTALIFAVTLLAVVCVNIMQMQKQIRQIALFRSIGITKRQLRQMQIFEMLFICIPSVALGILFGAGGTWLLLRTALFKNSAEILVDIPFKQVGLAVLCWLFGIILMRLIVFQTALHQPLTGRLHVARKKARRIAAAKRVLTVALASLFCAAVFFMAVESASPLSNKHETERFPAYQIYCSSDFDYENDVMHEHLIPEKAVEQMRTIQGMVRVDPYILMKVELNYAGSESSPAFAASRASDKAELRDGYYYVPYDDGIHSNLYAYPEFITDRLLARDDVELDLSAFDRQAYERGEQVLLFAVRGSDGNIMINYGMYDDELRETYGDIDSIGIKPGDKIELSFYGAAQKNYIGDESEHSLKTFSYTVGGIVYCSDISTSVTEIEAYGARTFNVAASTALIKNAFAELTDEFRDYIVDGSYVMNGDFAYTGAFCYADIRSGYAATDYVLAKKAADLGVRMSNRRESLAANLQTSIQQITLILSVGGCIAVIMLMLLMNALTLEAREQMRNVGILRAIGMSGRQAVGKFAGTALINGLIAAAVGWVVYAGYAVLSARRLVQQFPEAYNSLNSALASKLYGLQRFGATVWTMLGLSFACAAVIVLISLAAKGRLLCGSPIEKLNENRD